MTWQDQALALLGGVLLGGSAGLLLVFDGRVVGVSGVLARAHRDPERWRRAFLCGLLASGAVARGVAPDWLPAAGDPLPLVAGSGFLVGVGSHLANGCTSGHGVCGMSRGSARSGVAVLVFLSTGTATASLVGWLAR